MEGHLSYTREHDTVLTALYPYQATKISLIPLLSSHGKKREWLDMWRNVNLKKLNSDIDLSLMFLWKVSETVWRSTRRHLTVPNHFPTEMKFFYQWQDTEKEKKPFIGICVSVFAFVYMQGIKYIQEPSLWKITKFHLNIIMHAPFLSDHTIVYIVTLHTRFQKRSRQLPP